MREESVRAARRGKATEAERVSQKEDQAAQTLQSEILHRTTSCGREHPSLPLPRCALSLSHSFLSSIPPSLLDFEKNKLFSTISREMSIEP